MLPYTFEDALVFENLSFFSEFAGTGLVRKFRDAITDGGGAAAIGERMYLALKSGKKAEFALDVMEVENFDDINVLRVTSPEGTRVAPGTAQEKTGRDPASD
ncbi:hypothetical protein [Rhizobium nepotum]|uniref:hypothetical protein n=1 Tax=Rhizobium nepotum TaxID=1035271 RepID=UPI003CEF2D11